MIKIVIWLKKQFFEDISKSDVRKTTKNSASGPGKLPVPPSSKIIQIGHELHEKSSKNHPFFFIKKSLRSKISRKLQIFLIYKAKTSFLKLKNHVLSKKQSQKI